MTLAERILQCCIFKYLTSVEEANLEMSFAVTGYPIENVIEVLK